MATLNPALLSKWIMAYSNEATDADVIAFPCGGAFGVHVIVPATEASKVVIKVVDAGHKGTLMTHTRANALVTVVTETGKGHAFAKALLHWMTSPGTTDPTNPRNNRILELTNDSAGDILGVACKTLTIDFDSTA